MIGDRGVDITSWAYQDMMGQPTEWTPKAVVRTVTTSGNINPLDGYVRADATSGAITLTLETAVAADGRLHYFKKIDSSSNAITLDGNGSETIDGSATYTLPAQYDAVLLKSNGSAWEVFGEVGTHAGGASEVWARVDADGTLLASERVTSVTRLAEGMYRVTITPSASTVAGELQINAVATPTTSASGASTGGASTTKAFSDATYSPTDNGSSTEPTVAFYSSAQDKIYVLGHQNSAIYVHRLDSFFPMDPTTISPGTIRAPSTCSGCMKREGDYIWLSGNTTPYAVRAVNLSTGTVTGMGTTTDIKALASASIDGTHYLFTHEATNVKMYAPDLGAGSLGAAVKTWTLDAFNADAPFGIWDNNGMLWLFSASYAAMLNPSTGLHYTHIYPGVLYARCAPAYDNVRNRFYLRMGTGTSAHLYTFSGWSETAHNSGVFTIYTSLIEASALWFDEASDVLYALSDAQEKGVRMVAATGTVIDSISVDDVTPNLNADYELLAYPNVYYTDDCAYFLGGRSAGGNMLVRCRYRGESTEYFVNANIGAASTDTEAHATYVSSSGDIWLIDPSYQSDGGFYFIARLFVFDIATETWTEHAFDSTWYRLHGNGHHMLLLSSWDQMIINSATAASLSAPQVWQISTKTRIDNYWTYLSGSFTQPSIYGLDQTNNRVCLRDAVDPYTMKIWSLNATTHMPSAQLSVATVANPIQQGGGCVDSSGNFWYRTDVEWIKQNTSGFTAYTYDADGSGNVWRGTFAYDSTRNCIYYWGTVGASTGKLKKIDCSTGTMSTIATYQSSQTPILPNRPMYYDASRDRLFVVFGSSSTTRDYALYKVEPTTGNYEHYVIYERGSGGYFRSPNVCIDTDNGIAYSFSAPGHLSDSGLGRIDFATLDSLVDDDDTSINAAYIANTRILAANQVRVDTFRLSAPPVRVDRQFSLKVNVTEA